MLNSFCFNVLAHSHSLPTRFPIMARFLPVTEQHSVLTTLKRFFRAIFLLDFTDSMNDRNLRINVFFRCLVPVIGSIRKRWQLLGTPHIILTDWLYVAYSCSDSGLNRFHKTEPEKLLFQMELMRNLVFGWAKKYSWQISLFFPIYLALFSLISWHIISFSVIILFPMCLPEFSQGKKLPHSFIFLSMFLSFVRNGRHRVLLLRGFKF